MRRRDLLFIIGGAVAVLPRAGRAEQQRRVGLLRLASADVKQLADIRRGLEGTGYVEGRNLVIEYRYADGDYPRLSALAADLVRNNVEVIMTSGGPDTAKAAMQATATIPIVGTSVAPLVRHFNRPEGNVTGVSITTGDLMPKRLQTLAEIVPGTTIGVLMNPAQSSYDHDHKSLEDAARALGVKLDFATASADPDLDPAFASLARQHVGALLPEAEPFLGNRWQLLVPLAARYAIPTMHEWREAVVSGGLISYAPPLAWVHYQVGRYTGQILNGAKPADLPVIAPTKYELVINLKTAGALGLTIPQSLIARADEVIE
jgi:putative tryptophan/tyrosine transport system substrate-binding protein